MRLLQKHWDKVLLGIFILIYIVTLAALNILRHEAFASGLDLGNMDQTVWNTLQGRFFTLTTENGTVSRFYHHADLLLIVFAPFYAFGSSPHVLNILESVALGLGAIPTYLIARHVLKNKIPSLAIAFIYLLSPLLQWVDIFDFHAVSFATPALLAAFYCILVKRWRWYALFVIIALLSKEQISLQIIILGLIITFFFKERKVGLLTTGMGVVWFLTMFFIVIPHYHPSGSHWAFSWYSLGDSVRLVSQNSIQRLLFDPEIRTYYSLLLKSYGFLPLLGFPWLVLSLPDLVINVLSSHPEMHSIKYHYPAGLIPGLVISSIYGLNYIRLFTKRLPRKGIYILIFVALAITVRTNYHHSPLPTTQSCWCVIYQVSDEDKAFERLLRTIPQGASVTASTEIHAHVTHREHSYILPFGLERAEYVALIDQNRIIDNYGPKPYELSLIKKLSGDPSYALVERIGHFYLYRRAPKE